MANAFADSFSELFIGYDIYYVDKNENIIGPKYKKVKKRKSPSGENVIYLYATDQTTLYFDISEQLNPDEPDFARGTVPATIYLTNETVKWDFDDGTTAEGLKVEHTFDQPGEYTVKAFARDYDGRPRASKYLQKIIVSDFVKTDIKWVSDGNQNQRLDLIPAGRVSEFLNIYTTTPWRHADQTDHLHTLSVYASGSQSQYIDPDIYGHNKYTHFEKTWRFTNSPQSITPLKTLSTPATEIIITTAYIEVVENNEPTGEYEIVYIYTTTSASDIRSGQFFTPNENYNVLHSTQVREYMTQYDYDIRDVYNPNQPIVHGYRLPELVSNDWRHIGHESLSRVCYMDDTASMYLSQQNSNRRDSPPVFLFASINTPNTKTETFYDNPSLVDSILPNIEQRAVDVLPVGIVYNPPRTISFTSTGIQSMKINEFKLKDSLITFNVALVDETGLNILKSNPNKPICPDGDQLYNIDLKLLKHEIDGLSAIDVDFEEIEHEVETPGSCSLAIPGLTTGSYQLSATCSIKDLIYMNKQVESYFVANMHSDNIFVFRPGYMDHEYTFHVDHTLESSNFPTRLTTLEQPVQVITDDIDVNNALTHFFCMGVDSDSASWIADTDRDALIKLDRYGNHMDTILVQGSITNIDETAIISPKDPLSPYGYIVLPNSDKATSIASIAIDQYNNIWTAIADTQAPKLVKITEDGTHDKPQMLVSIVLEGFEPSEMYPAKIETDRNNNVWVSILIAGSHIDEGYKPDTFIIVKYDQIGNQLIDPITFDYNVHIHDMIVDGHNNLWVTNSKPSTFDNKGSLIHISEDGEVLKHIFEYKNPNTGIINKFDKPSQLALDMYDHLWVVHTGNTLTKFKTGQFEQPPIYTALAERTVGPSWDDQQSIIDRQGRRHAIEGMSTDTDDRVLVVNNVDKKFYMFTSNNDDANIIPGQHNDQPYNEEPISLAPPSSNEKYKPDSYEVVQAFGDWTGVRWIQKYFKFSNTIRSLSGISDIFNIVENTDIQKQNEDIDMSSVLESISFQRVLNESTSFQHNVLSPVVGDIDSDPTEIGKTFYEKISNFTRNNIDVDTCNMEKLYSLASTVDVNIQDHKSVIPASLKRKLDMLSVSYNNLKGSRDSTEESLNNIGYISTFNIGRNLGKLIDPKTYNITAGVPIVTLELFNNIYKIVMPMTIMNPDDPTNMNAALSEYPLRSYNKKWGWGLSFPEGESFMKYYDFFEFKPNVTRNYPTESSEVEITSEYMKDMYDQLEGLIDWNNNLTTTDEDITYTDFIDKDQSFVDMSFEQTLRKGLSVDE
ncbi:PKD domain-containing protein [bacterium]|nr:PKD domain-containing protein [bacterium]